MGKQYRCYIHVVLVAGLFKGRVSRLQRGGVKKVSKRIKIIRGDNWDSKTLCTRACSIVSIADWKEEKKEKPSQREKSLKGKRKKRNIPKILKEKLTENRLSKKKVSGKRRGVGKTSRRGKGIIKCSKKRRKECGGG